MKIWEWEETPAISLARSLSRNLTREQKFSPSHSFAPAASRKILGLADSAPAHLTSHSCHSMDVFTRLCASETRAGNCTTMVQA